MAQNIKNPATRAACRARNVFSLAAVVSENNSPLSEIQCRRAQWLARRHALPLSMAYAVAGLAFPEREGAR
jgi:hypothetical protein